MEYVVARNTDDKLIVLQIFKDQGTTYINNVFAGPYTVGQKKFFATNIIIKTKRLVIKALFERV